MKKTIAAIIIAAVLAALAQTCVFAADMPQSYGGTDITPVQNQKNAPLCWAYSGADMLNISAVSEGIAQKGTATYSPAMFARGEFDGYEHRYSRVAWEKSYGDIEFALMPAALGKGLHLYSDYPDTDSARYAPTDDLYNVSGRVAEIHTARIEDIGTEATVKKIKSWVYEYGAVSVTAFIRGYDAAFSVALTDKFDNTKAAHALLVVGWDDNKQTAEGKGAYLVKNTWGNGWGDNGYAYLPYNAELGYSIFAARVTDKALSVLSHCETMYQTARSYSAKDGVVGALNVYEAPYDMTVEYAGACTEAGAVCSASVWIVNGGVKDAVTKEPDAHAEITAEDSGFMTFPLDKKLTVKAGTRLAVLTTTLSGKYYRVYSEYQDPDYSLCFTKSEPGQTYVYINGELSETNGNLIGSLYGTKTEQVTPATQPETTVAQSDTAAVTENDAQTAHGAATEETGADASDTSVIAVTDDPPQTTAENAASEPALTDTGTVSETPGAGSGVLKVVGIIAAVAAGIFVLLLIFIFAAVAASKKDK